MWYWYKDREIDLWNRIEKPETYAHINNGAKTTGYPYVKKWTLIHNFHQIQKSTQTGS